MKSTILLLAILFTGLQPDAKGASPALTANVVPPSVTTATPTQITINSAFLKGEVTSDGGGDVTARGFVWGVFPLPTEYDNVIDMGTGTGAFEVTLTGLEPNTQYYVRAFATNSSGTTYGANAGFRTEAIPIPTFKVVAQDGSGDYTTVQAAFDDVPMNEAGPYTIFVKNGVYYEKLRLLRGKTNVRLIGEHRDSTILTYDDYANIAGGTSNSYSVSIDADDFTAYNITFQNTVPNDGSAPNQQAVALSVNGDRQAYYNVNILGYQDTFYARGSHGTGRIYIKNSYIEGSVDFIFGRNIVVIDSSRIHINRNNGIITAAATESGAKYGFVFRDVEVTVPQTGFDGNPVNTYHLGRPWQGAPRTVFINTTHPAQLHPEGWRTWNVEPAEYAEFNCMGPGCADLSRRLPFSRQLTEEEAAEFTLENIFSASSYISFRNDWIPSEEGLTSTSYHREETDFGKPLKYGLHQNYPNPFNPSTVIRYEIPESAHVLITVHDTLGRHIATLENTIKPAGEHEVRFDASEVASGVYLYRIESGGLVQSRKMSLIR